MNAIYLLGFMLLVWFIGDSIWVKFLDKRPRVAVMVGSDSDLPQCEKGLNLLYWHWVHQNDVKVIAVYTNSIHRNMFRVFFRLLWLWYRGVDCIITGAGWAAHLPGMCNAFYAYVLRSRVPVIIPVAFAGGTEERDQAAILSISQVPSHGMVLNNGQVLFGEEGFHLACIWSLEKHIPFALPEKKPSQKRSVKEAVEFIKHKQAKK